jgi:hypothetical protein
MDVANLIISLVSGIVGGNAAGAAMQDKSLGPVGNSITGLLGGGSGGYLMKALGLIASAGVAHATGGATPATGTEGLDIGSIVSNVVGSGVGGAILTAVVAWIKDAMQKT